MTAPHTKILVTGSSGFMGRALLSRLCAEGREVVGFDLVQSGSLPAGARAVTGSITDPAALQEAMQGCDAVVHLAALVQTHGRADVFRRVNVDGTELVARTARDAGVRHMVFMSSLAVFDYARGFQDAAEDAERGGRLGLYGRSKLEAERLVEGFHGHGLTTTIVRPALLPYGPEDANGTAQLLGSVKRRDTLLVAQGNARLSTCYIDNLIDGIVLCVDHENAPGQTFHITDDNDLRWRDLVGELARHLGVDANLKSVPRWLARLLAGIIEPAWRLSGSSKPPPLTRYAIDMASRDLHFSCEKAKRQLGYQARVPAPIALARTAARFLAQPALAQSQLS